MGRSRHESSPVCHVCADQIESWSMEEQVAPKTFKYKLKPNSKQERALERTLMLCPHV